jgi:histidinol-phosphate aminotransferase
MAANVDRICVTRQRTTDALAAMGFQVLPSQANFIFTRPPLPAARFAQDLRDNGILVRHFSDGRVKDYVRVSIGTDEEMDAFLNVTEKIVAGG